MMQPKYRIKEIHYIHHNEFWVEKSIRIFGFHLTWQRTTSSYYARRDQAIRSLEDITGDKTESVYNY